MDDALFDEPVVNDPMYSATSLADSPVRMDMEEYDSTATDMLMSIGVDKLSAQQFVDKLCKKPDGTFIEA